MSLERQAERSKHAKAHAGCGGGRSTTHRVQFALSHPGHTPLVASGGLWDHGGGGRGLEEASAALQRPGRSPFSDSKRFQQQARPPSLGGSNCTLSSRSCLLAPGGRAPQAAGGGQALRASMYSIS